MASHTVPVLPMPGAEPVRNTMKFAGADTYSGMNSAMTVAADRDRGEEFTAVYSDVHAHKDTESHMGAGMAVAAPKPGEVAAASFGPSIFSTGERHQQHHVASGTLDIDGDGNVDTLGSKNISADAPDWFRVAHTHVNTEKGDRLRRLQRKPRMAGRQRLDGRLDLADALTPRERERTAMFDPTSGQVTLCRRPKKLGLKDSILPARQAHARSKDPLAVEARHKRAITAEPNAFYRRKGPLEEFLEQAHSHADMLVWQSAQLRDDAESPLNNLRFRPATDFYDTMPELGATSKLASSPLQHHRHRLERARSTKLGPGVSALNSAHAARAAELELMRASRVTSASAPDLTDGGADGALGAIRTFERQHHQTLELNDFGKRELKQLIVTEGLEVPGKMNWDPKLGKLVKEDLPKRTYVDFIRRAMYERDQKPLVRRGKNLGPPKRGGKRECVYCVVSLLKARKGGVRAIAYDTEASTEHQLLLIPSRLEDLDVLPAPDAADDDAEAWAAWGIPLIERLILSPDGTLRVGPPPLKDNGLPQVFSLAGQGIKGADAQVQQKNATSKRITENLPSRMHVTMFFNMM